MKVIHSYEKKNLKKLRRNNEADCTKCAFAEKTPDIEGGYVWMCHAALYDIKTLSCFVPRNTRAPILSAEELKKLEENT